jgi:hypothetical protein
MKLQIKLSLTMQPQNMNNGKKHGLTKWKISQVK